MSYVIGEPKFIQNLDGWLFENDQKYAKYIKSVKSRIPPMFTQYNRALYRGMTVDESFLVALDKGIKFDSLTSWSKDESLAKKFATDPKYKVTGAKSKNKITLLIKKVVPSNKIIFDIHGFIQFMGDAQLTMLGMDELNIDSAINEQEVLIDVGVTIKPNDVKFI